MSPEKAIFAKKIFMQNKSDKSRGKRISKLTVKEPAILIDFLMNSLKDQSRTTVKSLLSHQQIIIKNKVVRQFDYQLNAGDEVNIHWDQGRETLRNPLVNIVYEDKYLIVIEKAAGLLSIATQKEIKKTAYSILSEYVKSKNPANKIFIVHRLDRETSGLMLFAKNEEVQYKMQNNWRYAINQRKYTAVVEGKLETGDGTGEGIIKSYLWESKALIVYSSQNPEDGQLAVTKYKVIKSNDNFSLIELELETGRKNQIRVHMNSIGYPLVGDIKYGGHKSDIKRMALHANVLSFTHPITNESLSFTAQVPEKFKQLVK